jgi:hypothetical protein
VQKLVEIEPATSATSSPWRPYWDSEAGTSREVLKESWRRPEEREQPLQCGFYVSRAQFKDAETELKAA